MEKFGKKLRALRQRRRLSLRQLAKMLEVSHPYIVQLEQGDKTPNAEMILKIADVFEVSIDILMRDELELDESNF